MPAPALKTVARALILKSTDPAMKKLLSILFASVMVTAGIAQSKLPATINLSPQQLKNKIMGGWAGQTIGVTYGGPVEFKFNGTWIQESQPIAWYDGYLKETMTNIPGLYDDIYMDLTFVDVIERLGMNAPVDSFAYAFANAEYKLWHANQAARYNILNGIKAPLSGHWLNNPHADDIDYQIEADYAGLMSPGMPNAASAVSDKIGHIMNYGDGWYGGVYVGAMYSLAFVSNDIRFIVTEALKTIPAKSDFYKCIADVIKWQKQYPNDWKQTWFELQKKWSMETGCPHGVFDAFNIDAKINAAYAVMGLLYGNGDFGKSIEIAARAGQDADCNPSTAAGVLGTMMGYDKIPAYWKAGLKEIEDMNFKYTTMSLNKVYEISYKHALQTIRANGGKVDEKNITIKVQQPAIVKWEQSFEGIKPVVRVPIRDFAGSEYEFSFEGTGIVLEGVAEKTDKKLADVILNASFWIDGKDAGQYDFPTLFTTRKLELLWKYQLSPGKHTVKMKINNPQKGYELRPASYIIYR